jgi:hypothetical protein
MELFKIVIVILLFLIFVSLAVGLWYLWKGDDNSTGVAKSLTWRIGLSILLFVLLMAGFWLGWIQPQ